MKKLFSDPHFNVMDGLDTYIDDYGKPDPIPPVDAAPAEPVQAAAPVRGRREDAAERRRVAASRRRCISRWCGLSGGGTVGRARPLPRPLPMTTLICDCNKTMPLDGPALRRALGPEAGAGLETVHSTLCRREAGAFQRAAKSGDDLLVACTQESRLFLELNEADRRRAERRRAADPLRQHPRDRRLVEGRGGGAAEDGRADRRRAAAAGRAGADRSATARPAACW